MKWFAQHAKTLAVTAIAVGGLMIATQTGARAVAAALVQITNTTSAPGVVLDVSHAASQIVELTGPITGFENGAALQSLQQLNPATGQMNPSAFVIPQGQSLVVTGLDWTTFSNSTPPGSYILIGENLSSATETSMFREFLPLSTEPATHLKFDPGIVFVSGHTIQALVNAGVPTSSPADYIRIWGYLTSN